MKPLANDPEGHSPHGPRFGLGYLGEEIPPAYVYQPTEESQEALRERLLDQAEKQVGFDIKVDNYQAWCELDWREPHGTVNSAERLAHKLSEEIRELKKEIYAQKAEKIEDEAGDVLWCVNALSSNLGISVKNALSVLLDQYGHGIRYFESFEAPPWVKEAQRLTFDAGLQASGIDKMISQGYEPQPATNILVDDPGEVPDDEKQLAVLDLLTDVGANSMMLIAIAKKNYGDNLYQSGHITQADIARHLIARLNLDLAYIAHHAAGSSMAELIRKNILKLSGRVAMDAIDKTDQNRQRESE